MAVKSLITVNYDICKESTHSDQMETVALNLWRNGVNRRVFVANNPPQDEPNLTWLETSWWKNDIFDGDMNALSRPWCNENASQVG